MGVILVEKLNMQYEALCRVLDQMSGGAPVLKVDLFFIHAHLQESCQVEMGAVLRNKDRIRRFLSVVEVHQAAGELLGPWRVSSEMVIFNRMRAPRSVLYTFSREGGS
jgi:hypothetical protein